MVTPVSAAPSNTFDTARVSPKEDVRVLIDISGSMKHTDPNNLRTPALKLFVSLLPDGSNAGVWTFGQWVNMLVKSETVNKQWKKRARNAAEEINSLGLFTNIEDVIRRSTWDWKHPDPNNKRSLILLTDGLVDISKDTDKNAASRQRILDELLPQLKQANVTIHAIALSQEADHDLLRQLSAATNGWFETVETADGLERLFLRMFEKTANTDKLPLVDNRVTIDNSVREATFLVFRKSDTDETSITAPSGNNFNSKTQMENIQWYREDRYDLITISNPEKGEWQINAALDPDNRVMIVTDLKLRTSTLPSSLEASRSQIVNAQLEQDGNIITRKAFLRFVRMTLFQTTKDGQRQEYEMQDNGKSGDKKANDGIYAITLDQSLQPGEHEIEILVDGKTFQRTSKKIVKIFENPADIALTSGKVHSYTLSVIPYQDIINPDTLLVSAQYTQPSGEISELEVPRKGTNEWTTTINAKNNTGEHKLVIKINGTRHDGSLLEKTSEAIIFSVDNETNPQGRITPSEPVIEPIQAPAIEPVPESKPEPEKKQAAEEEKPEKAKIDGTHEEADIDWLMVSLRILVFNIILGVFIFGGYKLWPFIKSKIFPNPVEALSND